jgi:TipAS antibiotic-recognition domain/MerR family regulatory protein
VATLAGVSVRTLHHYDEIGLLSPSGRSDAGYRLYSHADLERVRHRMQIDRWYYPCSHAVHQGLGEMYVADPRFAEKFESYGTGLAAFLRDAIRANAAPPVMRRS